MGKLNSKRSQKIFDLTKKGIDFMEESVLNKNLFFLQISHYAVHANLGDERKNLYSNFKTRKRENNTLMQALQL